MTVFLSEYQIDDKKRSSNRWKAAGIAILAALEFILLCVVFVPLGAAVGAIVLALMGFITVATVSVETGVLNTIIMEKFIVSLAVVGGVLGGVTGIFGAVFVTLFSIDMLKETTWAGFKSYDSLWDLLIHGEDQKTSIVGELKSNHSFFKTDSSTPYPENKTSEGTPLLNLV